MNWPATSAVVPYDGSQARPALTRSGQPTSGRTFLWSLLPLPLCPLSARLSDRRHRDWGRAPREEAAADAEAVRIEPAMRVDTSQGAAPGPGGGAKLSPRWLAQGGKEQAEQDKVSSQSVMAECPGACLSFLERKAQNCHTHTTFSLLCEEPVLKRRSHFIHPFTRSWMTRRYTCGEIRDRRRNIPRYTSADHESCPPRFFRVHHSNPPAVHTSYLLFPTHASEQAKQPRATLG